MTTLENSYCVPRTVEEWGLCLNGELPSMIDQTHIAFFHAGVLSSANENGFWWKDHKDGRTQIPVTRFLDLLHDRICDWRVEERGLEQVAVASDGGSVIYGANIGQSAICVIFPINESSPIIQIWNVTAFDHRLVKTPLYITTFTDLLTLIRMLTPPSK